MFSKILIANRGEIAVRVLRACRELGVRAVAVHSEADASALHVRWADEALGIGNAPSADSYLNIPRIIEAARRSGAQAIHPGYGFLSEHAAFAEACREAGMVFIGPEPETIRLMGDKEAARNTMRKAGVPVLPGAHVPGDDAGAVQVVADRIGYPLLVKATHGGGGKGMRMVEQRDDLLEAWRVARAEAFAACGSDAVYVEAFIPAARHIEQQILADGRGHVVACGERECSVQRRRQKLIEESPSVALTPRQRHQLETLSVRAAKKVGYTGAGTLEFILDRAGRFYFIEMNTRIQVEHPVTEAVTGLDLVSEQIRVAAGEALRVKQAGMRPRGHAIECRINAEDPERDFLPSPGIIEDLVLPGGPGVRVDTALFVGYAMPHYYDSLAAKIIVHADTRPEAIARMVRALEEFRVKGIATNVRFLMDVLKSSGFKAGDYSTDLVAQIAKNRQPWSRHDDLEGLAGRLSASWWRHVDE